jgi:hypothetical protein
MQEVLPNWKFFGATESCVLQDMRHASRVQRSRPEAEFMNVQFL